MKEGEFQELVNRWLNGRVTDAEFESLQGTLREDGALRREFVRITNLDSGLKDLCAFEAVDSNVVAMPESPRLARAATRFWAIAATFAFFAALLWILIGGIERGTAPLFATAGLESTKPIAVITGEAGAVWESQGGVPLQEGASIGPGRLVLRRGLAQIDFFGGASLSLSGPAEIELLSRDSAILHRGRIKADVPPAARGFEIRAGDVLLEDLGTSFGLAVGEQGSAGLVVFDGEVRATGADGKPVLLLEGDAVQLEMGKPVHWVSEIEGKFPDISDVFARAGDREESKYAVWREKSLELRKDPRLVAYYDFENLTLESRRLKNRASLGGGSELDGGIVGAKVTEGRWGGKTALDFRRIGDRVRFQIPGEFDNLTIFAWVRIDALDRNLSSLFLTDYYDPNEFHWQISNKGALHFATSPMGVEDLVKNNRRFYSDYFWDPSMSGRWFLLATTVDRSSGKVTHYINGESVGFSGGTNQEKPLPRLRIGEADLGNWSDPIWPDVAIRTLNGRIDEFALFRETLSADEIRSLYEHGKP